MSVVLRLLKTARAFPRTLSWHSAHNIAVNSLPWHQFSSHANGVSIPAWNLAVPRKWISLLARNYRRLALLRERFDDFQVSIGENGFDVTCGGLIVEARADGDFACLEEILARELYGFELAHSTQCVVWDIGMNVGIASLYFAGLHSVSSVVACELFQPTYEQALRNFARNPARALKIEALCCGVSDRAGISQLPYAEEAQGVLGFHTGPSHYPGASWRRETVVFEDAYALLERVRARARGLPIVIKMDCEGAEVDILRSLSRQRLDDVALVVMEWHGEDRRRECVRLLSGLGFTTSWQRFDGVPAGPITAVPHRR